MEREVKMRTKEERGEVGEKEDGWNERLREQDRG